MAMVSYCGLPAQTEGFYDSTVSIDVLAFYVVEQPAPLAHEHQQAPSRVVVLSVNFQVFSQV